MSQPPPDWWERQRGPRFGCADVTIVSIASITAFVILIFVLLRPDFARVVDVPGGNGNSTVAASRATETPVLTRTNSTSVAAVGSGGATPVPTTPAPAPPVPPATTAPVAVSSIAPATQTPTSTLRKASLKDQDGCRLRQDAGYDATVIQIFGRGSPFKIYNEQKILGKDTWLKVEPDDGTSRVGWMLSICF